LPRGFDDILSEKRILVCAGSGGVGKTTTAAALALAAARAGKKTLVLTIDPAKRLASSLGLPQLDHVERRVPDEFLAKGGPVAPGGELWAMMLDQKRAFDEIVERYARDADSRRRIFENRIYKQIAASLSGSHEYAAMAKLFQIDRERDYDMVVVDTPPTAHALDFLDAPEKVAGAIESPMVEWFMKPLQAGGRFSLKLIGRSGSFVLKRIAKFVGSDFLEDMAKFFVEFNDVLGGFRERAREVFALLRSDKVGFVLVAAPEPEAVDEALLFHKRLVTTQMPFSGFVVNRVVKAGPPPPERHALAERLRARPELAGHPPYDLARAAEALLETDAEWRALAAVDAREVGRLREVLREAQPLVEVPQLEHDVHDVAALAELGHFLVRGEVADAPLPHEHAP
jgi:anion-transporting  ArsA/GET3 family ATPase